MGLQMFLKLMTVAADVTVGAEWFQMQAAATPKARDRVQSGLWHNQLPTGRRVGHCQESVLAAH